ncbi:hypothetical protein ACQ4M3_24135 [Leptolyngbya sp. AN03gr2]|uniref:hypothetical protein n=1 Tax=unclassified Leptolyngbya TaxID=2650499 RepID=UPI003D30F2EB
MNWKLTLVLVTTVLFPMPMVQAASTTANSTISPIPSNVAISSMSPYELVFMAYQGRFREQGLRGYGVFVDSCNQGNLTANDLVQTAIKAKLLPKSILDDVAYMNAVDANMKAFKNSSR